MTSNNVLPATLSALLRNYSVAEGIQMAEQQVKMHPTKALHRHSLFQLLCVIGYWSRALQQIQLCARLDANYTREAQVFGELIRCEIYRQSCFHGEQRPGFILPPPVWMEDLLVALACNAHGKTSDADAHRSHAFETITDTAGQWNGGTFDWISDSDSRTGPVLELVTGGMYIWLPLSQIRSLKSPPPASLTDLIWKPVNITLHNGDVHGAWLFSRYSGSEKASDTLCLCRKTVWQDGSGETLVQALGQKMWLTSHGDISLLDLSTCTFNSPEGQDA
ncbi:SciE protein [Escherichia coli H605]|uniref:SciE protein n=2 Tax=Escherichia TaxID=561 RepID=A0AAJ3NZA1_ECOLX|nr:MULTISPECIES: type VI secretion system accessory protein TagJ [Escherichia]OSL49147.1 SciE protein [Escherichia coli H605]EFB3351394.1 impE family protein [Escherichia coli]EFH7843654.1 impE family protein [Escherichia coli]EJH3424713.1 impE family protein [Escherichia coli]MDR4880046.1 type VI secretion system accessory protein TagJ [Escherichia ruysiae]